MTNDEQQLAYYSIPEALEALLRDVVIELRNLATYADGTDYDTLDDIEYLADEIEEDLEKIVGPEPGVPSSDGSPL